MIETMRQKLDRLMAEIEDAGEFGPLDGVTAEALDAIRSLVEASEQPQWLVTVFVTAKGHEKTFGPFTSEEHAWQWVNGNPNWCEINSTSPRIFPLASPENLRS